MAGEIVKRNDPKTDVVIGIDFGDTNIGVAFARAGLASPIDVINGKNQIEAVSSITKIALENNANKIVIGVPLTVEGKETQKSHEVRRFAKLLRMYTKIPIEFVNEYLTTQEAITGAIESGLSQKARRRVDALSAAIILKKYFEELEEARS